MVVSATDELVGERVTVFGPRPARFRVEGMVTKKLPNGCIRREVTIEEMGKKLTDGHCPLLSASDIPVGCRQGAGSALQAAA